MGNRPVKGQSWLQAVMLYSILMEWTGSSQNRSSQSIVSTGRPGQSFVKRIRRKVYAEAGKCYKYLN